MFCLVEDASPVDPCEERLHLIGKQINNEKKFTEAVPGDKLSGV